MFNNHHIHKALALFACFVAIALNQGCTGVEYGPIAMPEVSSLVFRYDWSKAGKNDPRMPDSLSIAMARVVRETHYFWDTKKYWCADSIVSHIGNGEYFLVAFAPSKQSDCYSFKTVDEFLANRKISIDTLAAEIFPFSSDTIKKMFGSAFVESDKDRIKVLREADHIYSAVARETIYFDSDGEDIVIKFTPEDRSVLLTFTVNIQTQPGIQIDSVRADITGTPSSVRLMSGALDQYDICKTYFRMQRSGNLFQGNVRVLGLFSSKYDDYIYGAGVIRLAVFASYEGISQMFLLSLNIKEEIEAAEIMKSSDDNLVWTITKNEATIPISKPLMISRDLIINGNKDCLVDWTLTSGTINEDI